MKIKQNQLFIHGIYSNLTQHLFYQKNIQLFQILLKSKYLSFMTKLNPSNGNETKSDIFLSNIFKSDIISFLTHRKILKYVNDY